MTERTIPSGSVDIGERESRDTAPGRARRGSHPAVALGVIASCYLMLILDSSIVNIALPKIQTGLNFSATDLSWVNNSYTLAFGGLLLLGGRAGDILGRRRTFIWGLVVFTAASALCGAATSGTWLLAARTVQGIGAALASPSALSLIATNFREGPQRNRALSIYSTIAVGGGSLGLVLGGAFTTWLSWRWVFYVNLPIGVAVVVLAPLFLNETPRTPGRFDLAGALSSTAGMTAFVYAFIRAASNGWTDALTLGSFAAAAVLLAAFVVIESRTEQPITPLRLFADRNRVSVYTNMVLLVAAMFGSFFFLTQFIQDVLLFSPIRAGLAFLPMTAAVIVGTRGITARLLPRVGAKPLLVTGAVLVLIGVVWLSRLSATSDYPVGLLCPMAIFGLGMGLSIMPMNVVNLAGVAPEDAGAASAMLQACQWVGGSLGLGVLVTVFGTASRSAARHPLAGATAEQQAHYVMAHGIAMAYQVGVIVVACALVVALFVVRGKPKAAPAGAAG